ncbi:MAG: SLC13 family permease [Gemmataceae bacterium]
MNHNAASENPNQDQAPLPGKALLSIDTLGLILGPVVMLVWLLGVRIHGLNPEAHRLFGVLLLTVIWWITEPIPIPATSLLAVVLCVMLGAVPPDAGGQVDRVVLAPFANPSVYFLLGGMFIGRAMMRHGLDRRIALSILSTRWASRSPAMVLLAVGLAVASVSGWISNTAATAMIYPVTLGLISVLAVGSAANDDFQRSPYASSLLLATGFAACIGGVATPIGTPTNLYTMGFLAQPENLGKSINFFRFTLVGAPLALILLLCLNGWLRLLSLQPTLDRGQLHDYLRQERGKLGAWKTGEKRTLLVFLIVVFLWIMPGILAFVSETSLKWYQRHFPESICALLAPVLLFLLPVDWRRRKFCLELSDFRHIDWGTMLLFGAGLALGTLMEKTGLTRFLGDSAFAMLGTRDMWAITAVAIAGALLLSDFTSNTAAAIALVPVVWQICRQAGVDPVMPLMGVTFAASFGFLLPISTPPNAIVYGSGLVPMRRMLVAGLGMDIIGGTVAWCVLRVAWELGWSPFVES